MDVNGINTRSKNKNFDLQIAKIDLTIVNCDLLIPTLPVTGKALDATELIIYKKMFLILDWLVRVQFHSKK